MKRLPSNGGSPESSLRGVYALCRNPLPCALDFWPSLDLVKKAIVSCKNPE